MILQRNELSWCEAPTIGSFVGEFGIRIYKFNDDDFIDILFEQTNNLIMSDEQKKEAYLFYAELNDKDGIHFIPVNI